jgi:hypothetical protein
LSGLPEWRPSAHRSHLGFRIRRGGRQRDPLPDGGAAIGPDGIDPEAFLRLVAPCRGQISAVLVAEEAPGRVVVLKGNMPLEFRYSRKHRAVAYASDGRLLDGAIEAGCGSGHDWRPMVVRPTTMLVFRREEVFQPEAYRLRFAAA